MDNKVPMRFCEDLTKRWNACEDEEEKKKLTRECWFLRFYVEKIYDL